METIFNFFSFIIPIIACVLLYILKCIYTSIPAIFANTAPILSKNIPFLNYPIDFGLKLNGKPVFGEKKTFRGLLAGIIFAMILFYVQYFLFKYTVLRNLSLIDFNVVNVHLIGFLTGFGVLFGDLTESFIKRRLNIPPSGSFIPWDQIDCALGGLLFVRIVWAYTLKYAATILILTFFIHIIIRHIAYYLGLCESKW